ncbi:MAG: hypothetical protein ACO3XO_09895 [Bdellovibrionota bacterium]|jgi:hypothetical protein
MRVPIPFFRRISHLMTVFLVVGVIVALPGCFSKDAKSQFDIDREEREEQIARQEEDKERLERERLELERQKFWNEQLKRYE